MSRILAPLIVLALAVGLFLWTPGDDGPMHDVPTDVHDCTKNLHAIYDSLLRYQASHGELPTQSGAAFLGALVAGGALEAGAQPTEVLTCPGPGAEAPPDGTDFSAPESLDGRSTGYAARNVADHPLVKFPAGGPEVQALVACDNAHTWNHAGVLNVLYSDRTVKTLELERLKASGALPADATSLVVGPESPVEDLRALSLD